MTHLDSFHSIDDGSRFAYWRAVLGEEFRPLPDKPDETLESTLCLLWLTACGVPARAEKTTDKESLPALDRESECKLAELIQQRISGKPLAYITGRQTFMGLEFLSGPEALIPRKETELLARKAIALLDSVLAENAEPLVVDLCTGCGNIALTLASHAEHARVFGADLSEQAVNLAQRNAQWLKLQDRADFFVGDLLEPFHDRRFPGRISLITCNPPYISSGKVDSMSEEISKYEPRLAFDGGALGIKIIMRLLYETPDYLAPGGWLCFEVGAGQGKALYGKISRIPAFESIEAEEDAMGNIRVIAARKRGAAQ